MGLSPILVESVFETIKQMNAKGTTILLVEQNALMALSMAHNGYVLQTRQTSAAILLKTCATTRWCRKPTSAGRIEFRDK